MSYSQSSCHRYSFDFPLEHRFKNTASKTPSVTVTSSTSERPGSRLSTPGCESRFGRARISGSTSGAVHTADSGCNDGSRTSEFSAALHAKTSSPIRTSRGPSEVPASNQDTESFFLDSPLRTIWTAHSEQTRAGPLAGGNHFRKGKPNISRSASDASEFDRSMVIETFTPCMNSTLSTLISGNTSCSTIPNE